MNLTREHQSWWVWILALDGQRISQLTHWLGLLQGRVPSHLISGGPGAAPRGRCRRSDALLFSAAAASLSPLVVARVRGGKSCNITSCGGGRGHASVGGASESLWVNGLGLVEWGQIISAGSRAHTHTHRAITSAHFQHKSSFSRKRSHTSRSILLHQSSPDTLQRALPLLSASPPAHWHHQPPEQPNVASFLRLVCLWLLWVPFPLLSAAGAASRCWNAAVTGSTTAGVAGWALGVLASLSLLLHCSLLAGYFHPTLPTLTPVSKWRLFVFVLWRFDTIFVFATVVAIITKKVLFSVIFDKVTLWEWNIHHCVIKCDSKGQVAL